MVYFKSTTKLFHFIITSVMTVSILGIPVTTMPPNVQATFPGYSGKIAFTAEQGGGTRQIVSTSTEQSDNTLLTSTDFNSSEPQWSPDGSRLVFHKRESDTFEEIYMVNADGTGLIQLTNTESGRNNYPDWSPDGQSIIFSSSRTGSTGLWVMDSDGQNQRELYYEPGWAHRGPKWSPDGKYVLYTRFSGAVGSIYQLDIENMTTQQITSLSGISQFGDWFPDGSKIAFESDTSGSPQIYTINRDGNNLQQITTEGGLHPSWSPDGSKIAYSNYHGDANDLDIFVINIDDSLVIQISDNDTYDHHASWQSIPNISPTPASSALSLLLNTSQSVNVLSGSSDEEPLDPANLTIHTQPTHGTALIESGKVKYTPTQGYVGTDQITYQICDSFVLDQKCSTAVLGITVTPAAAVSKVGESTFENGKAKYVSPMSRPTFSGTATPGSTVKVEIHSDPIILTTTAGTDGVWSVTPDKDLPAGEHTVYISAALNGITTELDSFVLAVQQTVPNTGTNSIPLRFLGLTLIVIGSGIYMLNRQRLKYNLSSLPNLFP